MFLILISLFFGLHCYDSVASKPAEPLAMVEWLRGSPVTHFESGKVYVVEFWATWCGPCVDAMPHLSELQEKYRGAIEIIGVAGKEAGDSVDQKRANVLKFLDSPRAQIAYRIAFDPNGEAFAAYMGANQIRGIPASFVIDAKGEIAFIGHPLALDEVIPLVIAGGFDADAFRAQAEERQQKLLDRWSQMGKAAQQRDFERALFLGEELKRDEPNQAVWLEPAIAGYLLHLDRTEQAMPLIEKITGGSGFLLLSFYQSLYDDERLYRKLDKGARLKIYSVLRGFLGSQIAEAADAAERSHFEALGAPSEAVFLAFEQDQPQLARQLLQTLLERKGESSPLSESLKTAIEKTLELLERAFFGRNVVCEGGVCRIVEKPKDCSTRLADEGKNQGPK